MQQLSLLDLPLLKDESTPQETEHVFDNNSPAIIESPTKSITSAINPHTLDWLHARANYYLGLMIRFTDGNRCSPEVRRAEFLRIYEMREVVLAEIEKFADAPPSTPPGIPHRQSSTSRRHHKPRTHDAGAVGDNGSQPSPDSEIPAASGGTIPYPSHRGETVAVVSETPQVGDIVHSRHIPGVPLRVLEVVGNRFKLQRVEDGLSFYLHSPNLVNQKMKIITLWQPWASLIALKLKQFETRSWGTNYRGKLLIHAAKRPVVREELAMISACSAGHLPWEKISGFDYPLGCVVAIANLTDCRQMIKDFTPPRNGTNYREIFYAIDEQTPLERSVGDWASGRYAWKLENVIALPKPIPWKGAQGLRDASLELIELVAQLACV